MSVVLADMKGGLSAGYCREAYYIYGSVLLIARMAQQMYIQQSSSYESPVFIKGVLPPLLSAVTDRLLCICTFIAACQSLMNTADS